MGMVDVGGRARGARAQRCTPGRSSPSAVGAVSLVTLAGTARDQRRRCSRASRRATTVGTVALWEPGTPRRGGASRETTATPDGDGWRLDGTKVHVPDAVGADVVLVVARRPDGGLRRVRGRRRTPRASRSPRRRPSTAPARKRPSRSTATPARRARRRRRDRRDRRDGRPARRSAMVVDGVGAASRALELAVEYAKERRQFDVPDRDRSRPCSTSAPTCCASVELARAVGVLRVLGLRRAPTPAERHRAATMAQAFAADALYEVGATRDPGVRRRRLHVGARHPPLLQAPAEPPAVRRRRDRSARGARLDRARRRA